jgi:outer membrane protein OmpA-like peptidoglycan-associated protein
MLKAEARQSAKKGPTKQRINVGPSTAQPERPNLLWQQLAMRVQAKLRVSAPDDPYEREADQIANHVMRMPAPAVQRSCEACSAGNTTCARCEEEQRRKQPVIQRKPQDGGNGAATSLSDQPLEGLGSGRPLEQAARSFMEPRFGGSFADVRVHAGARAAEVATAFSARAFTLGNQIVFNSGNYSPESETGKHLLAHELTHVVQQRGHAQIAARSPATARQSTGMAITSLNTKALQRASVTSGGATPGVGAGIDLIFIIDLPKIGYIKDITKYVKTVLQGQAFYEVDNLTDIFAHLSHLPTGQQVRRIRLVSHGLVTGKVATINKEHTGVWWIGPKEVRDYAQRQEVKNIIRRVMAPGAVVEFWGCNIGRSHEAGQAWANLFHSTFRATTETFRTGYDRFARPARKHEKGITIAGRRGKWVDARNTSEIDEFADTEIVYNGQTYTLQNAFLGWLRYEYGELVKNGDILAIDESGDKNQVLFNKLNFMVRLFNRSGGDIRHIAVTSRTDPKALHPIRPGDGNEWGQLWVTFLPVEASDAVQGKLPQAASEKPAPPAHPQAAAPPQQPAKAPLPHHVTESPKNVPATEPPAREHPAAAAKDPHCNYPDSTPTGPLLGHVWFASNEDHVVGKGHLEITRFVASLGPESRQRNIRIDGYASADGPEDYNQRLSCRRAREVKEELVNSYGIPESHIQLYAHGKTSEFSPTSRSNNRVAILSSSIKAASTAPLGERTPPPEKKQADQTPGQRIIAALNKPDPIAGVGDFGEAFRIIDSLSMADMLNTLTLLKGSGNFDLLNANLASATEVNVQRIRVAFRAVENKGKVTPERFASDEESLLSTLPSDEQQNIARYLSSEWIPPLPPEGLGGASDAQLGVEYGLGLKGDPARVTAVEDEIERREDKEERGFGLGLVLGPVTARSSGSARVTPEVGLSILENLSKGEPPFRPELGKGGASWFVTEGTPYVGVDAAKNVSVEVEISNLNQAIIFTEKELDAINEEETKSSAAEAEAKFRERYSIDPSKPLSSRLAKSLKRFQEKFAQSRMWDRVGERVAKSPNKVGQVILENSKYSKQGNGKFAVVADAAKIRLKGGPGLLVDALEKSGAKVEPVVLEATEALASKLKWAGRVRTAFRFGGRILIVVAIALDAYKIYRAQDRIKAVIESVGGWAGATAGAAAFAAYWTPADVAGPWAWAVHGVGTLVAGGIGYWLGSKITRTIYEITVET